MSTITITAWNMRSLNRAGPYLHKLVDTYNTDVLCLSEHRLYNCELDKLNDIGLDFECHAKASADLLDSNQSVKPGHCGTAILWKNAISSRVRVVKCTSDRICAIEVLDAYPSGSLFIISVYLPHQQCKISEFTEHIDILGQLIEECKSNGEVFIVGDMNCHFGEQHGNRFSGNSTRNAKLLHTMIDGSGLEVIDGDGELCSGPSYTFHVEGIGQSYIDHCITSESVKMHTQACKVLSDEIMNTSDHLAISAKLNIYGKQIKQLPQIKTSSVAWNKLNAEQIKVRYTDELTKRLRYIDEMIANISDIKSEHTQDSIDEIVTELSRAIQACCDMLPQKKYSKHLKPYWSEELKQMNQDKREAWKLLKDCKVTNDTNPQFIEAKAKYKIMKKTFTNAIKEAKRQYEMKNMDELNQSHEIDIIFFWRIVNRGKKKKRNVHPIKMKDGTVISDPDIILTEWQKYFTKLFTPSNDEEYDNQFQNIIYDKLKHYINDMNLVMNDLLKHSFTDVEISEVIKSLKMKKAPGWDNLTAESLKHGGTAMIKTITNLCNLITYMEYIPWQFKIGLLIPIPKGEKDKYIQDNHRGITLLPVLGKVLEKCYMLRLSKWAQEKGIIIELQGANQENCSSIHTAWIVKEMIAQNNEKGKTTYIALLDIQKAFDTVWQGGMLYKLFEAGITGKLWRMIKLFYSDFVCKIMLNGKLSGIIKALCGIHQGAPCSMFFFVLLLNDLLTELQEFYPGMKLAGKVVNCAAFADDIALLATCKTDLQTLIDIACAYSKKWRFKFSPTKCVVIICGKDSQKNVHLKLGTHQLTVAESEQHLGNLISTKPDLELKYMERRIKKCQTMCYASQSIGSSMVPVSPVILGKLYESACLPKLLYAVEIMDIGKKTMQCMEAFHRKNAKLFQGLPSQACNIGSLTTMGWSTIEVHIDICRLLFMWRILLLPMTCLYKVIMIRCILKHIQDIVTEKKSGPVWKMIQACKRYNLVPLVMDSVMSGEYMPMHKWKKMINYEVRVSHMKNCYISAMMYKSLSLINTKTFHHGMLAWWYYAKQVPNDIKKTRTIVKLLLNIYRLGQNNCSACMTGDQDNISHILFECSALRQLRHSMWEELKKADCPPLLVKEIDNMSSVECTNFLLNAINCKFVIEWQPLYKAILQFVYIMYTQYNTLFST